ncbi:MAG: permease [Bifidobacterium sp.]|jgi:predicted permease|nr:permease [Bifidobacterium sp.]MCI1865242.1 permease [Bifidobacterium sp.]
MGAIIQPLTLLFIIMLGYAFKRAHLFGGSDYRVIQTAEFNLVLPGAIIYSFAVNPHNVRLLLISGFSLIAAAIVPTLIFVLTQHRRVSDRAFLMLNSSGFNIGCFSFPIIQTFIGPAGLVPAAMFDVGNSVMVAAGTNVMTRTLLHIQPDTDSRDLRDNAAPTLAYSRPKDRQARRLARRSMMVTVAKGFASSASFDTYVLMIVLMLLNVPIPHIVASVCQPFYAANAFCAMLMVGMLTDLPSSRHDVSGVLQVLLYRLPSSIVFAAAAWLILPFGPMIRESVVLCCLAPTAIFATMFTDRVLGNAKLAGFTLCVTAVISLITMTCAHLLIGG